MHKNRRSLLWNGLQQIRYKKVNIEIEPFPAYEGSMPMSRSVINDIRLEKASRKNTGKAACTTRLQNCVQLRQAVE
jgi:hypothetical protein